jgi:hypothetical protein
LSTAFVVFESLQQVVRAAAARRAGQRRAPADVLLPVLRGVAAIRLMMGRPGRAERALLTALVAGIGAIVPASQDRDASPGTVPEETADDAFHAPSPMPAHP